MYSTFFARQYLVLNSTLLWALQNFWAFGLPSHWAQIFFSRDRLRVWNQSGIELDESCGSENLLTMFVVGNPRSCSVSSSVVGTMRVFASIQFFFRTWWWSLYKTSWWSSIFRQRFDSRGFYVLRWLGTKCGCHDPQDIPYERAGSKLVPRLIALWNCSWLRQETKHSWLILSVRNWPGTLVLLDGELFSRRLPGQQETHSPGASAPSYQVFRQWRRYREIQLAKET